MEKKANKRLGFDSIRVVSSRLRVFVLLHHSFFPFSSLSQGKGMEGKGRSSLLRPSPFPVLHLTRQQGYTILIFTRICMRFFVGDNRVQRNDAAGPPRQQGFMRAGVVLSLPLAPPLAPPASSLSLSLPHPLALSLLLPLSCSFTHSLLPSLSTHMVPVRARIGAGTKSRLHLRAPTTVYRSEG